MKVKVYFNLHKKLFSVVALEGPKKGRVIEHTNKIDLFDCSFRVQQAGRKRVLKEQRKNVHAYASGWTRPPSPLRIRPHHSAVITGSVKYNPYKYSTFVDGEDESPVFKKECCRFAVDSERAKILILE